MATIAITGAARGIGFELAKQHLAAGDRVFALVRDPANAAQLDALVAHSDGRLSIHAMDVADAASIKSGAAATGSDPIDILYNVAGVIGIVPPELEATDWEAFDTVIDIMLKGPLRVLQAFLPRLHAGAKVINFSSQLAALGPGLTAGYYSYVAAKAGLGRLMRSVAIDLKDRGIIIGIIHPGYVQTDMGGAGADITPQESASGIRKLASEWTLEHSGDFYKWNGEPHPW